MAGDHPIMQIGELTSSISETHKLGKEKLNSSTRFLVRYAARANVFRMSA